jgi:hypothetical protein
MLYPQPKVFDQDARVLRTVTTISVKRDILDRWLFNLGTLEIQTAGMSGQTGAE